MILTCPQCASRYQVADGSVPPQGRTVRCAGCGAAWRAMAEGHDAPLELVPPPPPSPEAEPAKVAAAAALPKSYRAKTQARKRTREAAVAGAVWGVLGAAVVALVVGAGLFRVEVVRLWPRTAGAYAKVGMPVNPIGLSPENVVAAPGLKDGHAAVIVTGVVRNVQNHAHDPQPLRVSLLSKAGKPLVAQTVALAPGRLQPGQTRPFTVAFLDPPTAAHDVEVEFALTKTVHPKTQAKAHGAAPTAHAQAGLRGSAEPTVPFEAIPAAEPLPADSPHALPPAAAHNTHHPHEG
jgi:predicted Zn finger-like uncharacterized protein